MIQIGPYRIDLLESGRFALDGGAMFGVVPKTLWSKNHPADEANRISLALRTLLLRGDGRVILVDTGMGNKFSPKHQAMYGLDPDAGDLLSALAAHGLTPEDVTDVILTHLHFDHAGGATCLRDGEVVPTFGRARYWVQQRNWDWACQPTERDQASYLPENFQPLMAAGQLELLQGEGEILPGISAWISDGHTIGQQIVRVHDDTQSLVFCADIIPTASHLRLPFIMGYDLQPLVTLEEKRQILSRAAAENWLLVFEHDPLIPAAYVQEGPKGFAVREALSATGSAS